MRFSSRLAGQRIGLVRKLTDEAAKLNRSDKIFLSIGAPELPPIGCLKDGFQDAFAKAVTRYTPTAGLDYVRQAFADTYRGRQTAYPITADSIILTAGSQQAIFLMALGTLDPGDQVIVIGPAFFSCQRCASLMGAETIEVPYRIVDGQYRLPLEELRRAVTDRTRLIYFNNPNNPTGAFSGEEEVRELARIADETGVYILSDEVYKDLVYDKPYCSPIQFTERCVIVDSVSKTFSATGARVGWLAAEARFAQQLLPAHQQIMFSLSSINQHAAWYVLQQHDALQAFVDERRAIFAARRDLVQRRLAEIPGLASAESGGALYFFPRLDPGLDLSAVDFCYKLMYDHAVIVVPGCDFGSGLELFFRIAYSQSLEKLSEALERIAACLDGLWRSRQ